MKDVYKKWVTLMIALLVTAVVIAVGLTENRKSVQVDVVFLGDSIIGNESGEESIVSILEERIGKSVYNGAFGGSCLSFDNEEVWESNSLGQWSMVKLAQAIYTNDWTSQLAAVSYAEKYRDKNLLVLDYFQDRMEGLASIDFSQVEILLIEHGSNDYNCGRILESKKDLMDVSTFSGALRTTLSLIKEKYPEIRIILVSPIYCQLPGGLKSYEVDLGGGILDAYVQKEKEIAEEYGVEWIDLYYESGIWEDNVERYLFDGLHPTDEGKIVLGNKIADYLVENDDAK